MPYRNYNNEACACIEIESGAHTAILLCRRGFPPSPYDIEYFRLIAMTPHVRAVYRSPESPAYREVTGKSSIRPEETMIMKADRSTEK